MTLWDVIGYVAFVTNVAGNLLLTRKNAKIGFAVRLIPNVLWFAHGLVQQDGAIVANAVTFFVINSLGILGWDAVFNAWRARDPRVWRYREQPREPRTSAMK